MPRKPTTKEALRALEEQMVAEEMDRVLALTPEQVDAELRAAGLDPDAVVEHGKKQLGEVLARREQQGFAKSAASPGEKLPRAELLARIERARADPRLVRALVHPEVALLRTEKFEKASDEELADLLARLEARATDGPDGERRR